MSEAVATKKKINWAEEAWQLFLLALAEDKGEAGRLFKEMGGSRGTLEQAIKAVRGS